MSTITERVRDIVEPLLAAHHLEVIDVEHVGASLRVTVDKPGGVDLDAISGATRIVSVALDEHDPIPGRYTLEVSSPGLERSLRTPAHFERAVGEQVAVKLPAGVDERRLRGTLVAAEADTFTIRLDDATERQLRYEEVEKARTVFEWGPAPKPGRPGKKEKV